MHPRRLCAIGGAASLMSPVLLPQNLADSLFGVPAANGQPARTGLLDRMKNIQSLSELKRTMKTVALYNEHGTWSECNDLVESMVTKEEVDVKVSASLRTRTVPLPRSRTGAVSGRKDTVVHASRVSASPSRQ